MPTETVTLTQARHLLRALLPEHAVLLLSPPGVGKSDLVAQAAADAGLACRSLVGTQIAPEDVSGVPRIVGERSVFCPPRVLLPEDAKPFCLFLDELPACSPDVQKAFYSLILERRVGEHRLPAGSWVIAAGNRLDDHALVRAPSSALVNRLLILNLRTDVTEWIEWAALNGVRADVLAFVALSPDSLLREPSADPEPFSTPRSWVAFSRALDKLEGRGRAPPLVRAVAEGYLSANDAASFCALREEAGAFFEPIDRYLRAPEDLPAEGTRRWLYLGAIRQHVARDTLPQLSRAQLSRFFLALPPEEHMVLLVGLADRWLAAGLDAHVIEHARAA